MEILGLLGEETIKIIFLSKISALSVDSTARGTLRENRKLLSLLGKPAFLPLNHKECHSATASNRVNKDFLPPTPPTTFPFVCIYLLSVLAAAVQRAGCTPTWQ